MLDFYLKGAMMSVKASTVSGVTFEGTLYRSVTKGANPLEIHQGNIDTKHRYTGKGTGGLYFSTGEKIVDAELNTWAVATEGRVMHAFDVKVHNLLDLSNPEVRKVLGVTLDDILSNDYTITQQLGQTAKSMNDNGIIAPSARADGGLNVILFDATSIK
ncbi:RES family NAD+ phosphorylase [Paenibacillus helianthi]